MGTTLFSVCFWMGGGKVPVALVSCPSQWKCTKCATGIMWSHQQSRHNRQMVFLLQLAFSNKTDWRTGSPKFLKCLHPNQKRKSFGQWLFGHSWQRGTSHILPLIYCCSSALLLYQPTNRWLKDHIFLNCFNKMMCFLLFECVIWAGM